MGWIHEDPERPEIYDHEGYAVAVREDGTELEPIQVPLVLDDSRTSPNSAWWLYNGKDGRPLAAAVKAGCACGWRSANAFPIDWDDHEETEGAEYSSGPWLAWSELHIRPMYGSTMPRPLVEALDTVRQQLDQLAGTHPLLVLNAVGELERIASHQAPQAALTAKSQGATWDAIGRALRVTRQAAYQRFGRHVTTGEDTAA